MTKSVTFTEGDTQVMIAVLKQVGVSGIDLEQLRVDLGINNRNTVRSRLFNLRKKLGINPKANVDGKSEKEMSSKKREKEENSGDEDHKATKVKLEGEIEQLVDKADKVAEDRPRKLNKATKKGRATNRKEDDGLTFEDIQEA